MKIKLVVTHYSFTIVGSFSHLLYSTASLLYAGKIGQLDVVFLYGDSFQEHEFAFLPKGANFGNTTAHEAISIRPAYPHFNPEKMRGYIVANVLRGVEGLITIWESSEQLVLYSDTKTAGTFWAPILQEPGDENVLPREQTLGKFGNFWSIGSNSTVLVGGPHLVRSATYTPSLHQLDLVGDLALDKETYLTLLGAPTDIRRVRWNGHPIDTMLDGSLLGQGSTRSAKMIFKLKNSLVQEDNTISSVTIGRFDPPELLDWTFCDSLPEIQTGYDDSAWVTADHNSTNIPYKPLYGDKVLYGCDYGL